MTEQTRTNANTEALWTKRDVATYLGVTVRTVENMAIPRVTLSGRGKKPIVRFDPAQVRAWVDARRSRAIATSKTRAGAA